MHTCYLYLLYKVFEFCGNVNQTSELRSQDDAHPGVWLNNFLLIIYAHPGVRKAIVLGSLSPRVFAVRLQKYIVVVAWFYVVSFSVIAVFLLSA